MSPGAVPRVCWMTDAPTGTSAWRACSPAWPGRAGEEPGDALDDLLVAHQGTFMTSAMASRVMSSWVGPSPPQTITPSLRARAVRSASTIRRLVVPYRLMEVGVDARQPPAARPAMAELVSAIWPSRSSVPTATISTPHTGGLGRRPAAVAPGTGAPVTSGESGGHPDGHVLEGAGGAPAAGASRWRWPGPGPASSAWPRSGPGSTRPGARPRTGRRSCRPLGAAMRPTGSQGRLCSAARANRALSTTTLSASGSRKAPERVVPCRRASHPSTPSLKATTAPTADRQPAWPPGSRSGAMKTGRGQQAGPR